MIKNKYDIEDILEEYGEDIFYYVYDYCMHEAEASND